MSVASSAESRGVAPEPTGVTLVVGLGNPLLGDDGIGWRVAEEVRRRLASRAAQAAPGREARTHEGEVEIDHLAVGGLALMERLVGYRRAVLVDAMVTGEHPPGTVRRFAVADVPGREATHLDSAHDASLATALAAGRALGADLPSEIAVIAIEAVRVTEFVEVLTPEVEAAVPAAVEAVLAAIGDTGD